MAELGEGRATCQSTSAYYADVSLPVKLRPYASIGTVVTECCGEPVVTLRPTQSPNGCCSCELCIIQSVCIRVAVEYGATADGGDATVSCRKNVGCTNSGCR